MYLRCNRRFKDGKEHCYWNIVEATYLPPCVQRAAGAIVAIMR